MGMWDMQVFRVNFDDHEVSHISSIPLSNRLPEDRLIWNFEKDGEYSVKTAYHLLGELRRINKPGSSTRVNQKLWKNLWKVSVNERIKNFNWRLAKDILPTKVNLSKKRVIFSSPLGVRIPFEYDVRGWLAESIAIKECVVGQVVMTTLWKIWQTRNNVIFKDASLDPCVVAQEIWDAIEETNGVLGRGSNLALTVGNNHQVVNSWVVQLDAGCFPDGTIVLGCVIKDPTNNIFLAVANRLSIHASMAEIVAIHWNLQLARSLKIEKFIIQSDALVMLDCINGVDFIVALDLIVSDCKILLGSSIDATLMYISCDSNLDAHMVGAGKFLGFMT